MTISLSGPGCWLGSRGYVTNLHIDVTPANKVNIAYHDLWEVEASFRMSRSALPARPIYSRKQIPLMLI